MTSGEAITIVINAALGDISSKIIFNEKYSQLLDVIEKDLDVLEILKKVPSIRLKIQEWSETYPAVTYAKERKIVKEWLNDTEATKDMR